MKRFIASVSHAEAPACSAAHNVCKPGHEFPDPGKLAARREELELGRTDRTGPTLERCWQCRGYHRPFIQQSTHAGPRGHVEHPDHVEGIASVPRRACFTLFREFD